MKLKLLFACVSFLLIADKGLSQVADSIAKANARPVQYVQQRALPESLADSAQKANLIQSAKDNPAIKNSIAYQLLIYGKVVSAVNPEQEKGMNNSSKANTSSPH